MSEIETRRPLGSTRATIIWAVSAGLGLNLVLSGLGLIVTRWQLRGLAAEIDMVRRDIGDGFAIVGAVLLAVGLALLAYAYRRRAVPHRWWIASVAGLVAFLLSGNLIAFLVARYFGVLL